MTAPHPQASLSVDTFTQRFSATRRGARLARILAGHQLDVWGVPYGSETFDTITLVVAELAANAVRHGRVPGRDFALRLTYDGGEGLVRVEVSDTHDALPRLSVWDPDADGGRGLRVVDALAVRWGTSGRTGPGKTVWAVCALADRAGAGLA
ncbi:ATP-binding protein [Streptomyces sp. NPDC087420]|uniref:ATP-binding protein n=1 Tax=Streptomyces sp. NPDC087420 TaxID=3365785 RepID=UPI00383365D6